MIFDSGKDRQLFTILFKSWKGRHMPTWMKIGIGVLAALGAFTVLELLFAGLPVWLTLAIGLVFGFVIAVVLLALSRGEDPVEVAEELVTQAVRPDPGVDERPVHEQLARLNQRMRLDGNPGAVLAVVEDLIDHLRNVVPRALDAAPSAESTFDLKQLATEYLPKLVNEFLDLSPANRSEKEGELVAQLNELIVHVTKLEEMLDHGQIHEFEVERGFVATRFAKAS